MPSFTLLEYQVVAFVLQQHLLNAADYSGNTTVMQDSQWVRITSHASRACCVLDRSCVALLSQCDDILIGRKRLKAIHGCICRLGTEPFIIARNVHSSEHLCLSGSPGSCTSLTSVWAYRGHVRCMALMSKMAVPCQCPKEAQMKVEKSNKKRVKLTLLSCPATKAAVG